MKRTIASVGAFLLVLTVISGSLEAQVWNPRDRDRNPRQPTQPTGRPGVERGVPTAPTANAVAENRQPIPPGPEAGEPSAIEEIGRAHV